MTYDVNLTKELGKTIQDVTNSSTLNKPIVYVTPFDVCDPSLIAVKFGINAQFSQKPQCLSAEPAFAYGSKGTSYNIITDVATDLLDIWNNQLHNWLSSILVLANPIAEVLTVPPDTAFGRAFVFRGDYISDTPTSRLRLTLPIVVPFLDSCGEIAGYTVKASLTEERPSDDDPCLFVVVHQKTVVISANTLATARIPAALIAYDGAGAGAAIAANASTIVTDLLWQTDLATSVANATLTQDFFNAYAAPVVYLGLGSDAV